MKTFIRNALLIGAIAGLAGFARAVPTLQISDGVTTITVADGSALDVNSAAGAVTFIGSLGSWNLNVDTGFTYPAYGTAANPLMDLSFGAVTQTGGTIWIEFSENGFTGPGNASLAIGGTTDGSLAIGAFGGNSNTLFDVNSTANNKLLRLPPIGMLSGNPFSASGAGAAVGQGPYSLTEYMVIVQNGAGATTGDAKLQIPDGGTTALLLGFGLIGMSFLAAKFKTAKL